jgi:transposase-like protein
MKKNRVAPEIKEQIIGRIKNDGLTIKQVAQEHGIPESTVATWLARRVDGQPSLGDIIKLKKENDQLKILIGEITLKLSETQKKK